MTTTGSIFQKLIDKKPIYEEELEQLKSFDMDFLD